MAKSPAPKQALSRQSKMIPKKEKMHPAAKSALASFKGYHRKKGK